MMGLRKQNATRRLLILLVSFSPLAAACNGPEWGTPQGGSRGGGLFQSARGAKEDWEILCARFEDEGRIRMADDFGAALKRVNRITPAKVRVVHDSTESRITYGPYPLGFNNKGGVQFTPEINRDLDLIRHLAVGESYPFFTAVKQPATPTSIGPPEWDLRRAKGVLTLQIGVFFNTPTFSERKEAAVEWVKDLRQRGVEAYYFHGPMKSTVTVGSFDESAVRGTRTLRDRSGNPIAPRGPTRDYSPEVIKLRQNPEFAHNMVNGAIETVDGTKQVSFLVMIPKGEAPADAPPEPPQ